MRWSQIRKMALSLPVALLAALLLVGINETSYQRSRQAVGEMAQTQHTRAALNRLLQNMLDAETGLRGFLLTGEERYLAPYEGAVATLHSNLDALRSSFADSPEDREDFSQLAQQIGRKLSEMALSLDLRRQGNEDAWRFVIFTDVGKENMDAIRTHALALIERADRRRSRLSAISESLRPICCASWLKSSRSSGESAKLLRSASKLLFSVATAPSYGVR